VYSTHSDPTTAAAAEASAAGDACGADAGDGLPVAAESGVDKDRVASDAAASAAAAWPLPSPLSSHRASPSSPSPPRLFDRRMDGRGRPAGEPRAGSWATLADPCVVAAMTSTPATARRTATVGMSLFRR